MKSSLDMAIHILGSQSALASRVGVKQAHVWNWLNRQGRQVPADKVIAVSRAADWKVTPHELRSDIYPNPTDGIPVEKLADLIASGSIKTISSQQYTQLLSGECTYSASEQERRGGDRRQAERRDHERRAGDRREAS